MSSDNPISMPGGGDARSYDNRGAPPGVVEDPDIPDFLKAEPEGRNPERGSRPYDGPDFLAGGPGEPAQGEWRDWEEGDPYAVRSGDQEYRGLLTTDDEPWLEGDPPRSEADRGLREEGDPYAVRSGEKYEVAPADEPWLEGDPPRSETDRALPGREAPDGWWMEGYARQNGRAEPSQSASAPASGAEDPAGAAGTDPAERDKPAVEETPGRASRLWTQVRAGARKVFTGPAAWAAPDVAEEAAPGRGEPKPGGESATGAVDKADLAPAVQERLDRVGELYVGTTGGGVRRYSLDGDEVIRHRRGERSSAAETGRTVEPDTSGVDEDRDGPMTRVLPQPSTTALEADGGAERGVGATPVAGMFGRARNAVERRLAESAQETPSDGPGDSSGPRNGAESAAERGTAAPVTGPAVGAPTGPAPVAGRETGERPRLPQRTRNRGRQAAQAGGTVPQVAAAVPAATTPAPGVESAAAAAPAAPTTGSAPDVSQWTGAGAVADHPGPVASVGSAAQASPTSAAVRPQPGRGTGAFASASAAAPAPAAPSSTRGVAQPAPIPGGFTAPATPAPIREAAQPGHAPGGFTAPGAGRLGTVPTAFVTPTVAAPARETPSPGPLTFVDPSVPAAPAMPSGVDMRTSPFLAPDAGAAPLPPAPAAAPAPDVPVVAAAPAAAEAAKTDHLPPPVFRAPGEEPQRPTAGTGTTPEWTPIPVPYAWLPQQVREAAAAQADQALTGPVDGNVQVGRELRQALASRQLDKDLGRPTPSVQAVPAESTPAQQTGNRWLSAASPGDRGAESAVGRQLGAVAAQLQTALDGVTTDLESARAGVDAARAAAAAYVPAPAPKPAERSAAAATPQAAPAPAAVAPPAPAADRSSGIVPEPAPTPAPAAAVVSPAAQPAPQAGAQAAQPAHGTSAPAPAPAAAAHTGAAAAAGPQAGPAAAPSAAAPAASRRERSAAPRNDWDVATAYRGAWAQAGTRDPRGNVQFAAVPAPGRGDSSMPDRFRTAAILAAENWNQVITDRPPSRALAEVDKLRDDLAAGMSSVGGVLGNPSSGMSAGAHPTGGPAPAARAAGMTRAPAGPGDGRHF